MVAVFFSFLILFKCLYFNTFKPLSNFFMFNCSFKKNYFEQPQI